MTALAQITHAKDAHRAATDAAQRLLDTAERERRDLRPAEQAQFDGHLAQAALLADRADELQERARADAESDRLISPILRGGAVTRTRNEPWLPSRREFEELRATGESGSVFIPTEQSAFFVDRLRANSAIFGANFQVIPVPTGTLRIPRISTSVTVSALAENTAITPSDAGYTSTTLTLKKVAALTNCSSEVFADSRPALRSVVSADLSRTVASTLDQQFCAGSGSSSNMLGIRNFVGTTAGPSLGVNGGTPTLDNFATMLASFEIANGSLADAVWICHPRTWGTIRGLKDSQQRYQLTPVPSGAEQRSLWGIPVVTSTNVSVTETLGTSSDTSWVALVDKSQVVIGHGCVEGFDPLPPAQFASGFGGDSGGMGVELAYSSDWLFGSDQVAVRVTARFDIQPLNAAAIVLTTGVRP